MEWPRFYSMNITLRDVKSRDAAFLYHLHATTMKDYVCQTWGAWDDAWQSGYFREHFDPAICKIIVWQGVDIGVIAVSRRTTEIFLNNIQLLPAYQNQGIGRQLIELLIGEAAWKDIPVTLQVLKVNPARKLYERLGFLVIGETPTHYQMGHGILQVGQDKFR